MPQLTPASQIAEVLVNSLHTAFPRLCIRRYGAADPLQCVDQTEPLSSTVRLQIDRAGLPVLQASFSIRHVGGNMYDVQGAVEDGPSRSFSYCLPDPAPLLAPKAPRLAQDVAGFLLDALEQRLGRDLLRSELRRSSTTAGRTLLTAPPSA